jgi:hypothetical protein
VAIGRRTSTLLFLERRVDLCWQSGYTPLLTSWEAFDGDFTG